MLGTEEIRNEPEESPEARRDLDQIGNSVRPGVGGGDVGEQGNDDLVKSVCEEPM